MNINSNSGSRGSPVKRLREAGVRRLAAPNTSLSSPSGLTGNIPTSGPVYIMRGAVYLNEEYKNKSGFSQVSDRLRTSSNQINAHTSRGGSPNVTSSGLDQGMGQRETTKTPVGQTKKGVSFALHNATDDNGEAARVNGANSSSAVASSSYLPSLREAQSRSQRVENSLASSSGEMSFTKSLNKPSFVYGGSSSSSAASPNHRPLLLRPMLAHQTPATEAIAREAERFIESELKLLDASAERDPVGYRAATAQTYCQAVRMMLPQLDGVFAAMGGGGASAAGPAPSSSSHAVNLARNKITIIIERCLREFEQTLTEAFHAASQPTRSAKEREKLEQELRLMYLQASEDRERELDKRQEELDNFSTNTAQRIVQLENQLNAAKQEINRLKAAQNEESDRFSSMAQSVLESRLAAQKAEIAMQEMKDRYDKVKVTEMVYMDLLKDHQDMNLMLREKRIPFKTRIHFSVDDLLGEPTAAVLAQHAAAIRAKQQEEIAKAYTK